MNPFATEADALALDLLENADRPARVLAVAAQLAALAHRLHQHEDTVVPPHLRVPEALPPSVVRLCGRRAR